MIVRNHQILHIIPSRGVYYLNNPTHPPPLPNYWNLNYLILSNHLFAAKSVIFIHICYTRFTVNWIIQLCRIGAILIMTCILFIQSVNCIYITKTRLFIIQSIMYLYIWDVSSNRLQENSNTNYSYFMSDVKYII